MKKVKLIMLILSAFFVFGLQTASAQFVDTPAATSKIFDKVNTLAIDMDNAKQAGQMDNFYKASAKHEYYINLIHALRRHLTVSEAIDQTPVVTELPVSAATLIDKQFLVDLQQEAITLLKI